MTAAATAAGRLSVTRRAGRAVARRSVWARHSSRSAGSARSKATCRSITSGNGSANCAADSAVERSRNEWSRMAVLLKNQLKTLAGAAHPHLQRRNARSGDGPHLLVGEQLDVFEEKGFALDGLEALDGPLDGVAQRRVMFSRRNRGGAHGCFVGNDTR